MNRLLTVLGLMIMMTAPAFAGIDETINAATAPIATAIGQIVFFKISIFDAKLPLVVLWLVVGAVFFTYYTGFINLKGFGHAISLVKGDYSDPNSRGEVSHFQALATAVSGTVGIGNIGGVAVAVTVGGIKSIARVTEKIVPFMAVFYCVFAIIVILLNIGHLPAAIGNIFSGAFTGEGVAGGALGALIIGFQRAVFSNEAGIGSASIAHAAVKTERPITEGFVSLLEPFIDTIVICTITALVIGTSQVADPNFAGGATGVAMTSEAFERHLSWFPVPLAFAALLFAFSTMISWSYYGLKGWTYLFGEGERGQTFYKLIFCAFVILGCVVQLGPILDISDALVFLICVPNILGLYFLAPIVKRELNAYMADLNSGKIKKYK